MRFAITVKNSFGINLKIYIKDIIEYYSFFKWFLNFINRPTIDFGYIVAGIKASSKQLWELYKLLSRVLTLVDNKLMRVDNYKFKYIVNLATL